MSLRPSRRLRQPFIVTGTHYFLAGTRMESWGPKRSVRISGFTLRNHSFSGALCVPTVNITVDGREPEERSDESMHIRGLGTMTECAGKILEGVFGEANSSPKTYLLTL